LSEADTNVVPVKLRQAQPDPTFSKQAIVEPGECCYGFAVRLVDSSAFSYLWTGKGMRAAALGSNPPGASDSYFKVERD